jgi:secreted trypsin-like serine protease
MISRKLIYPLALLISTLGLAAPAAAQDSAEPSDEMIVNGEPVTEGEIPFQVLITAQWTDRNGSWSSTCGGSLISPQWVLTAAHCLVHEGGSFAPGELQVGYGSVYRSKLQKVGVEKVFAHQGYQMPKNDIGLLKLKAPIVNAKTVEFASRAKERLLRGSDQSSSAPLTLTVSGWGKLWDIRAGELAAQLQGLGAHNLQAVQSEIMAPEQLRKADLQEIAQQDCASAYGPAYGTNAVDLDGNICAMGTLTRKDSCQGDSGGPLFAISAEGPVQVGIVSWGHSCADDLFPGIYTRASSHADWIANIMSTETQAVSR